MNEKNFIAKLFQTHYNRMILPSSVLMQTFVDHLLALLFPSYSDKNYKDDEELSKDYDWNKKLLLSLLSTMEPNLYKGKNIIHNFYQQLPDIYDNLLKDAIAIESGDPAAKSLEEVIRSYPGFYAIAVYRIAHELNNMGIPFLPRTLTEYAHSKTGIDINPSAIIGESFFIDHGTGIVIGETTIIGNHVKLYQGVTLGALNVTKEMATTKRHPTIEDHVVIYAGATILGGNTIIGKNSIIGGNAWITRNVPANSIVYRESEIKIKENNNEKVDRNYW